MLVSWSFTEQIKFEIPEFIQIEYYFRILSLRKNAF